MKALRYFFILCIMTFTYTVDLNAQVAAKASKVVKELVKKGTKATKSTSKAKAKPKSNYYQSSTTAKTMLRSKTVECNTCKGGGKIVLWNEYYGVWQTQTCNKCKGTGRVKLNY